MNKSKLYININETAIPEFSTGVLCVDSSTIDEAASLLQQTMVTDEATILGLQDSINRRGFNPAFPIVLDTKMENTVDGFSRLNAVINLIERGDKDKILVPFITSNEDGAVFNAASRGASADDISFMFKLPKFRGVSSGSAKRAAEQAIEASQLLDVAKFNGSFEKAFDPTRTQRHTSKIVREREVFTNAFIAVCQIANELGESPDNIKWSHWMATFCRKGISLSAKTACKHHILENTGSTKQQRYAKFLECCAEIDIIGL